MEETNQCCLSCLCTRDEFNLEEFAIKCEPLKAIFQVDKLSLCYVCTRLLQHTEKFVQNVQSNQNLLQNLHEGIQSIQSIWHQVQPSITLSLAHLPTIEVTCSGDEELSVFSSKDLEISQDLKIKQELKEELDQSEEFIDGSDDLQDSVIKEEENFPLNSLKEEIELELDIIDLKKQKSLRKTLKSKKVKKKNCKNKKTKFEDVLKVFPVAYTRVHLTEAQCIAEYAEQRAVRAQDQVYLSSEYRCEKCAQGFALKNTCNAHLVRHSPSGGDFECSICTFRYKTEAKLTAHKKKHTLRYKCPQCDLACANFTIVKEHFKAQHFINDCYELKCPQCPKVFTRSSTLRKHIYYRHSSKCKVCCEYCSKTYANKETLRSHMRGTHSLETTGTPVVKRHRCNECGIAFRTVSQLKTHALKHSDLRPFFCVECDKSYKSAESLSVHLKTTAKHTSYAELPSRFRCDHCDQRFAAKRNLIRHMNQTHLNIRPYSCDKCDKTYINNSSLNAHKRYTHEGLKRPLRYPCSMCDKVFDRNAILKSHKRTHTGERPYQCSRCPAAFGQSSALGTHVRLVHLKLTRAGRPKTSPNTFI